MEKKVLMNEILTLLNKVNRQAQILVHLPHMARIDVDLLLAELRQVYDKTLDLQFKVETSRQEPKTEQKPIHHHSPISESVNQPTPHTAPKAEEPVLFPKPEKEEPELFPEPEREQPVQPVVVEYTQPEQVETTLQITPSPASQPKSFHQQFEEQNQNHSIASHLQYNPIHDLRSAIGINDKFLLMNQLFKGSLEQYNAAIEKLNNFYNYDDADIYLGGLKIQNEWTEEMPAIERLQHYVKRRYQKE